MAQDLGGIKINVQPDRRAFSQTAQQMSQQQAGVMRRAGGAGRGGGVGARGAIGAAGAGLIGGIAGAFTFAGLQAAASRLSRVFTTLRRTVTASIDDLSRYNGQLAAATIQAQASETLRRVGRGQAVGGILAGSVEGRDRLAEATEPLRRGFITVASLLEQRVVRALTNLANVATSVVRSLSAIISSFATIITNLMQPLSELPFGLGAPAYAGAAVLNAKLGVIIKDLEKILKSMDRNEDKNNIEAANREMLRTLDPLSGGRLSVGRDIFGATP